MAVAAVSAPTTIPLRLINQRFATDAANTNAIDPDPTPTITPHSAIKCHGLVIQIVPSAPAPTVVSAAITTRRIPNRSIKAAAKGAVKPKSRTLTLTAAEIVSRRQPNAFCNGTIKTDGAERNPAVAIKVMKVITMAIQAG